jgi:hypothetical protein
MLGVIFTDEYINSIKKTIEAEQIKRQKKKLENASPWQ